MASKHFWLFQITLISLNVVVSSFPDYSQIGQLSPYYYDRSCPRLEMIVRYNVWVAFKKDTRIAASLLRLHFHDCIVDVSNSIPLSSWWLLIANFRVLLLLFGLATWQRHSWHVFTRKSLHNICFAFALLLDTVTWLTTCHRTQGL